jgi:hypothetical protein
VYDVLEWHDDGTEKDASGARDGNFRKGVGRLSTDLLVLETAVFQDRTRRTSYENIVRVAVNCGEFCVQELLCQRIVMC